MRVSGWGASAAKRCRRSPTSSPCPTAPSMARPCWSRCRKDVSLESISEALVKAGATVRSAALVGSHATRYTVARRDQADSAPLRTARLPASARLGETRSLEMIAMTATRPQPRPGVLDIAAYVPGKSTRARRRQSVQALRPTRRRSGRARTRSRPIAQSANIWRTIRTARPRPCARRSALPSGSIRRASSAAPAPTICSICWRTPISRRRRGDLHHARLSGLPDRDPRRRRQAGGRAGKELHRRCRRDSRGGDAEDQDRLPRQSEQSDRHLYSVRRGQAPAPGRCRRMCCWCSTPPMRNMSGATITNPASSWSPPATTS